jgi:hypothetical protein
MKKIQRIISEAIGGSLVAEPYEVPTHLNGRKTRVVSVRENIIKIQAHDPINFLINVMNGEPIPLHVVDEKGEVTTEYLNVPVKERVRVAMHLSNKVMPTIQLTQAVASDDEFAPAKTGFDALVDMALKRAHNG